MTDPFKIDSPTCISFSGGRTSAYMLYKVLEAHHMSLPDEAIVCFANTGKEDEATLRFVQDCGEHWGVPVQWVEYTPDAPYFKFVDFDSASRDGQPFAQLISKKNYLPNPVARFCSQELKGLAIERCLKAQGIDADVMIGVRLDEPSRIPKLRARGLLLPLVSADVTQAIVQEFWKAQNFDLGLAFRGGVTPLGNCDLCFLKGPQQILGLVKDNPERAVWWAQQEKAIGATFRSDRSSYSQLHKFVTDQSDMFNSDGGISCFCGD
jgi:3'-phosphoadenosine 5'-phosphosulfate sulfotransferase (PAPS reductase)/FAD synthetase